MTFLARIVFAVLFAACALPGGAALAGDMKPASDMNKPGSTTTAPGWVFSAHALGPLKLYKGAKISVAKLKQLFPGYRVVYELGQGDSPDFHYFEVQTPDGQPLFSIRSFVDDGVPDHKTSRAVPIDLVQVYSPLIADAWGLHVGDHVKDIMAKRDGHLEFGASHHDVYLGAEMIYYGLVTERKASPVVYKLHDAVERNLEIRFISWPEAAWE